MSAGVLAQLRKQERVAEGATILDVALTDEAEDDQGRPSSTPSRLLPRGAERNRSDITGLELVFTRVSRRDAPLASAVFRLLIVGVHI